MGNVWLALGLTLFAAGSLAAMLWAGAGAGAGTSAAQRGR